MSFSGTRIEPLYVTDTHALIWYLTNDKKLGKQASVVFTAAERGETRIIISAVVVAELYYANQKNNWFPDFNQLYHDLMAKPQFRFVPLVPDHILDFTRDRAVPEMHDRIIAGLARRLGAPLLARDPQIIAAHIAQIVW